MSCCRRSCRATSARDRRLRTRLAAVRPSALDRLFERHHRPAQADRARPWRRHHRRSCRSTRCTTTSAAATRQNRSASAITGTARPAGSCGTARSPACSSAPPSASTTAAPAARRTSRTGRRCGASSPKPKVTFFGAGAAFFANCMKAGVDLAASGDLSRAARARHDRLAAVRRHPAWFNERFARLAAVNGSVAQRDIWWANISGGTDFAGAFVGGNRELPQTPGQMQCRLLGAAVEAWNEQGRGVIDEVGELVCTEPMPSMPLYFWDDDGNARYLSATSTPIRTISTAGRGRLAPRRLAQDQRRRRLHHLRPQRRHHQPPRPAHGHQRALLRGRGPARGARLDGGRPRISRPRKLHAAVRGAARRRRARRRDADADQQRDQGRRCRRASCPTRSSQVAEIPRTLSGKKQELPIKKLLLGQPIEKVVNREAMANPGCLDWYLAFAAKHLQRNAGAA